MIDDSTRAAAALASVFISLTLFHGVSSLAMPRDAMALAMQPPPAATGVATCCLEAFLRAPR